MMTDITCTIIHLHVFSFGHSNILQKMNTHKTEGTEIDKETIEVQRCVGVVMNVHVNIVSINVNKLY